MSAPREDRGGPRAQLEAQRPRAQLEAQRPPHPPPRTRPRMGTLSSRPEAMAKALIPKAPGEGGKPARQKGPSPSRASSSLEDILGPRPPLRPLRPPLPLLAKGPRPRDGLIGLGKLPTVRWIMPGRAWSTWNDGAKGFQM